MLLLGLLSACHPPPAEAPAVIVLVMDGVRAEESLGDRVSSATGLAPWETMPRVWEELVPQGARATSALNIGATLTAPAHCEMLSGRRQPFANYPVEALAGPGAYRPELPSVLEGFRAQTLLRRHDAVLMGNSSLIQPLAHSNWPAAGYPQGASFVLVTEQGSRHSPAHSDEAVIAALRTLLETDAPRLVIANLHAVDRAGHYGDAEDYPQKVAALDAPIADLWRDLQRMPAYRDNTHLILVSDHGRHREGGGDPAWREHGDACMGCRHVPLLLLGPHAIPGKTVDEPILLADLAPTIGALLGIEVPWAEGRMLQELLSLPLPDDRRGIADLSLAADVDALALSRYGADPARRSWVEADGAIVSSPDALAAEAPVLAVSADGQDRWLCFREITVDLDAAEAPWIPRCFVQRPGQVWHELPPLETHVGPFWQPVLLPAGQGGLQVIYAHNPNGHAATSGQAEGEVGLRGRRFDGHAWGAPTQLSTMTFPEGVAALDLDPGAGGGQLWAVAASSSVEGGRDSRQILLAHPSTEGDGEVLGVSAQVDFLALAAEGALSWRVERPALGRQGADLWLAALAHEGDAVAVVLARSSSGSGSERWSPVQRIDGPGTILPHLTPRWLEDGRILFAVGLPGGAAGLCHAWPGLDAAPPRCQEIDSERILDVEVQGQIAWVIRDVGVAQWEPLAVPLEP